MKYMLMIGIAFLSVQCVRAQEAVKAFASGENSFLLFTKDSYDSVKRYTIIRFSGIGHNPAAISWLDKVATVIPCEWSTAQEADQVLVPYHITSTAKPGHTLHLEGREFSVNTTSAVAYLVLLGSKPQLLCCGDGCETRLNDFFR